VTKKDMAELMKKSKSKGAKEIASLYGDPEGLVLALKSNSKTGLSGNAEVSLICWNSLCICCQI
jgi:hypothetical protein